MGKNGLEKTSRKGENQKMGFDVQRRENKREKGGFPTQFSVYFPFSSDQCSVVTTMIQEVNDNHFCAGHHLPGYLFLPERRPQH
jgi:hypothetical protein